jgi:hypothetical protein
LQLDVNKIAAFWDHISVIDAAHRLLGYVYVKEDDRPAPVAPAGLGSVAVVLPPADKDNPIRDEHEIGHRSACL